MKKLFILLIAAVIILFGFINEPVPENPYRLKTQIVESFHAEGVQLIRSDYLYDENGWLTEIQTYFDDALHSTRQQTMDAFGNVIRTETTYADGTKTIWDYVLTLDRQNRIIHSECYQEGSLNSTTEMAYSKNGDVTKLYINRIGAFNGEDVKSYVDRVYDRNGNLIREDTRWEPRDASNGYTQYTYQNSKLVKAENYVGEILNGITEYTYDDTGLIRTTIARTAEGTPDSKHITTFDEYGNELEVIAYAYASELARFGRTDEEPDSKTINIYERKQP